MGGAHAHTWLAWDQRCRGGGGRWNPPSQPLLYFFKVSTKCSHYQIHCCCRASAPSIVYIHKLGLFIVHTARPENKQLSVRGLGLLELCRKITIKIERAFFIILRASKATRHSFQQTPQPPAVAKTSGNSPAFVSMCQTGKSFPSHWRLSRVTAWYNYIIIATFVG